MYSFPTNCHKKLKGTDLWNFRGETFCLNCSAFYWRMFRFDDANLNPVNEFRAWSREHVVLSNRHSERSTESKKWVSTEPGKGAICTYLDQRAFSTEYCMSQKNGAASWAPNTQYWAWARSSEPFVFSTQQPVLTLSTVQSTPKQPEK